MKIVPQPFFEYRISRGVCWHFEASLIENVIDK